MADISQPVLPTAADVEAAAARLAGVALHTPVLTSPALDELTRGRVFLKAEILQRTGSFKFRGAYNKLSSIPASARGQALPNARQLASLVDFEQSWRRKH